MSEILGPNGKPVAPAVKPSTPMVLTGGADVAKPYENWKFWVDHTEKKGTKPKGLDEGFDVSYDAKDEGDTPAERTIEDVWELPPSFCGLCGNKDVAVSERKSRVAHMINREYPGLGLAVGSLVMYWAEDKCTLKYIWGEDPEHEETQQPLINTDFAPTFRADQKKNKAHRIEERVIGYIHARRMAGDRDKILGDETRKERFAELNERAD
jgi:hypothetical protein